MNAFELLADPVRRRIIEVMAVGERSAGEIGAVVQGEFGISQPAVSNQLRILRESGVATVEPRGARRLYRLRSGALDEAAAWLDHQRRAWTQRLDALDTEIRRGSRESAVPTDDREGEGR